MDRTFIYYTQTTKRYIIAGLLKELLLDYALNRLSVDMRSDLTIAIQSALTSSAFNWNDAQMLNMYLSGYTSQEIALRFMIETRMIELQLERIFTAIEEHSGYTDDGFINKLESTHKYRKSGMRALGIFLEQHSQVYNVHDIEVR